MTEIKKRNKNNRERGKSFEKKMGDFLGWIRVAYSGINDAFGWGDIRDHEDREKSLFLGECKSITPRSTKEINYIIKEEWLVGKNSIVEKAKKTESLPVLFFTKVRSPLSFAVLRDKDFKIMTDAINLLKQHGIIEDVHDVEELRAQIEKAKGVKK